MSREAPIRFLSIDLVLGLHATVIGNQGGDPGIRDRGLLDSALAMPRQRFAGEYLHPDVQAMAAAYAYHLCRNHPFIDGNKRVALAAMIAFFADNGWAFDADHDEAFQTMMSLATGQLEKAAFTDWVRRNSHAKSGLELRELFAAMTPDAVRGILQAFDRGSDAETAATVSEAVEAIPYLRNRLETAEAEPDDRLRAVASGQALLLLCIFRLSEDLGYEW